MASDRINDALTKLSAHDAGTMSTGLDELSKELPKVDDKKMGEIIAAISSIFYLDLYEYPQFQPVVDKAVDTIAGLGDRVIPHLLNQLGDSDFKVEFNYAIIFGMIGAPAIQPLLKAYLEMQDSTEQSFIIYSLGKIKNDRVRDAIPLLLESLESASKDVRDSAARTLGKITEHVKPSEIDNETVKKIYEALVLALKDPHSGVRSKSCRSLGKMAKHGYLDGEQLTTLKKEVDIILGRRDYNWDTAFVVRREASEVEEILKR